MNMGYSLLKNSEKIRVMNAVVAGTSTQNSTGVNMAGADGVQFDVSFGAITAGAATSIKLQQSDDDGSSDNYSDIAGSSITVADTDDNKVIPIEILKPLKTYVRCVVVRGTQNAVIDGIVATRFHLRKKPGTNDSTTSSAGLSLSGPSEGTA